MFLQRVLIGFALLIALASASAGDRCLQQHEVIYSEVLRVQTCLVADAIPENEPPVAVSITQTLTNLADRPIELQLYEVGTDQFGIVIFADRRVVSKSMNIPVPDAHDAVHPTFVFHQLAAGESMHLDYLIADFMTEPPQEKMLYTFAINSKFPFRYMNEPKGKAYALRKAEERARKTYQPTRWFNDVRLR